MLSEYMLMLCSAGQDLRAVGSKPNYQESIVGSEQWDWERKQRKYSWH